METGDREMVGAWAHLLRGGARVGLLPLDPQGAFVRACRQDVFLDLRSGRLISLLQRSSASATSFVLGARG